MHVEVIAANKGAFEIPSLVLGFNACLATRCGPHIFIPNYQNANCSAAVLQVVWEGRTGATPQANMYNRYGPQSYSVLCLRHDFHSAQSVSRGSLSRFSGGAAPQDNKSSIQLSSFSSGATGCETGRQLPFSHPFHPQTAEACTHHGD